MSEFVLDTPVLLIAFNRPEETQIVFDQIKRVKPKKLYIAADGPRSDRPEEPNLCEKTRKIINQIDWDCKLFTKFSNENLGCKKGVSDAITWAFESEEQLIILEDDCKPVLSFFQFVQDMLNKYKNDNSIMMISGDNYSEEFDFNEQDYIFSKIAHHIWGWATWKRAWQCFDINMDYYGEIFTDKKYIDNLGTKQINRFFKKRLKHFYNSDGKDKTWDYQWFFSIIYHDGLTIVPRKNLISNIGLEGAHTTQRHDYHNRNIDEQFTVEVHPRKIEQNIAYDIYHFMYHWNKMSNSSLMKKLRNRIRRLFH